MTKLLNGNLFSFVAEILGNSKYDFALTIFVVGVSESGHSAGALPERAVPGRQQAGDLAQSGPVG